MIARQTDRYTAEIILDYEVKHESPRQVFYQIFAKDNTLMMEGNWVHEGFTFCKVIDFFTQPAPEELTPEQIQEENNKFNSEFREEVARQNTTVETGLLITAVAVAVGVVLMIVFFMIIIISQRGMARVTKKPAKKLTDMIEQVRKVIDILRLQTQACMTTDKEMKEGLVKLLDKKLEDLAIMGAGTQKKIELKESFVKPESLVPEAKSDVSTVPPVKDEKEEKADEKVYAQGYGVESARIKEEITLATLLDREDEKKESLSGETDAEVNSDAESIEFDLKDLKPCFYCKDEPEFICEDCKKTLCKKHELHNCKDIENGKVIGTTKSIKGLTEKIIKSVFDKKDSIVSDDAKMQEMLDTGKSRLEVQKILEDEYMKIPYKEAREIYDKMCVTYEKNKTFLQATRNTAMLQRLARSDR